MRTSSVLLVNLGGVGCEVAKNIALAGVGKVTLLDGAEVEEDDLGANYFVREEQVGQKVSTRFSCGKCSDQVTILVDT